MEKTNKKWKARELAIGAVCVALAFGLSFVRLFHLPQGGSVTLASMLPIMLYSYIFGVKKGLIAALANALLQIVQDMYVVHWIQLFLDYILAYGCLALAGIFKNTAVGKGKFKLPTIFIGIVLAALIRYICHVVSGAVFFAEYAGLQNPWIYSLGYNSFVLVDAAICLAVMLVPQLRHFADKQREIARG